ncbi:MAG: dUTP diphosphatase [Chitinophagaceae bacterium]|jgi:dUTP pyrophosphatase|nr:dUTP diphosphatase [Chitinophagaceae bacterium]
MSSPVQVKIVNQSDNELPAYATAGAAGLDVRAFLTEPIVMQPMERCLVPTGLFLEIPAGYEAQVRPRSGLAIKQGITCLNTPGTIDSDYRGEVKVILINLDTVAHSIHSGDRIAQLVFQSVVQVAWLPTQVLTDTERGSGGFGHTGHQ